MGFVGRKSVWYVRKVTKLCRWKSKWYRKHLCKNDKDQWIGPGCFLQANRLDTLSKLENVKFYWEPIDWHTPPIDWPNFLFWKTGKFSWANRLLLKINQLIIYILWKIEMWEEPIDWASPTNWLAYAKNFKIHFLKVSKCIPSTINHL